MFRYLWWQWKRV